jgi:hypothetical protein
MATSINTDNTPATCHFFNHLLIAWRYCTNDETGIRIIARTLRAAWVLTRRAPGRLAQRW